MAVLPATPFGDFTGDTYPDLLAVQSSTGQLWLYPGRGNRLGPRVLVGTGGWNGMDELSGGGDLNRDGRPDLIARHRTSGDLYLYPGKVNGFAPRVRIGTGWSSMRDLVQVGDFNRDGAPDLIAIQKSTNLLFRYPGRTGGLGSRIQVGTSWGAMTPLA